MPCGCQNGQDDEYPDATPDACSPIDAAGLVIVTAGVTVLATLFMANLTGETSVRGIARKTGRGARHTYNSARNTIGPRK